MKNYYDELEINKNASKEVIEKVYKVLAKKYHPDTTKEIDKIAAEEKFKIISEAYEILSNDEKRKKYDLELEQANPTISYEEYLNVVKQRDSLNYSLNKLKTEFQYQNFNTVNSHQTYTQPHHQTSYTNYANTNTTNNFNVNNSTQKPNTSTSNNPSKKTRYYNTVTGKPVSTLTYIIYKAKQFIHNTLFFLLVVLALLLALKSVSNLSLPNSF